MNKQNLIPVWKGIIEADLEGFADPKTSVVVEVKDWNLHAKWVMREKPRTDIFKIDPEDGAYHHRYQ